jgi:hypothetical protein
MDKGTKSASFTFSTFYKKEDETLKRMFQKGCSWGEIAQALNSKSPAQCCKSLHAICIFQSLFQFLIFCSSQFDVSVEMSEICTSSLDGFSECHVVFAFDENFDQISVQRFVFAVIDVSDLHSVLSLSCDAFAIDVVLHGRDY